MTARIDSKFDIDTVYWTSKDTTFRRVDNLSIWAKPKQSSLYHVKVKDINGCIDSLQVGSIFEKLAKCLFQMLSARIMILTMTFLQFLQIIEQ